MYGYGSLSWPPLLWPSPADWHGILRALSVKLKWNGAHTALCHLARPACRGGLSYDAAYERVCALIAQYVYELAVEFGFQEHLASDVAEQLARGLSQIAYAGSSQPYWPTREEWLEIDRAAASYAYLDPAMTISSNLAALVARRTGMCLPDAKRRVHLRIAQKARSLLMAVGISWLSSALIQMRLNAWLNSFDAP